MYLIEVLFFKVTNTLYQYRSQNQRTTKGQLKAYILLKQSSHNDTKRLNSLIMLAVLMVKFINLWINCVCPAAVVSIARIKIAGSDDSKLMVS